MLEKTLERPLDCKEIKPPILKEMCPEYSLEGLMLKVKLQNFAHLMQRPDWLEKILMLGKIEGRKGTTEDEMVGWHHRLNGHESEQALGVGDGQGSLACYSSWGRKKLDTTVQLSLKLNMPRVKRSLPSWSENIMPTKYVKNYQSNSVIINNALNLKVFIHQTMQSFLSTLLLALILDPCSLVYDVSQLVSSSHTPDSQNKSPMLVVVNLFFLSPVLTAAMIKYLPELHCDLLLTGYIFQYFLFTYSSTYLPYIYWTQLTISCTQAADNWGD